MNEAKKSAGGGVAPLCGVKMTYWRYDNEQAEEARKDPLKELRSPLFLSHTISGGIHSNRPPPTYQSINQSSSIYLRSDEMLEYFSWKKFKAHKGTSSAKEAEASSSTSGADATVGTPAQPQPQLQVPEGPQPVLSYHDEQFLCEQLESADEPPVVILEGSSGTTTPRPSPLPTLVAETPPVGRDLEAEKGKEKGKGEWATGIKGRFGELRRTVSSAAERRRRTKPKSPGLEGDQKGKGKEKKEQKSREREEDELTAALEGLNLAVENGRAFSVTPVTKALLDRFIQILKDLANGVPTAYQDLVEFFDSSSKTLEETFTTLPSFLQKIIKTLPKRMQANLTPELLRTAAAVSPAAAAEVEALGALPTLKDLVTKPGLVMGMLKSVVNLLKTRFPAALGGANLALSMGLFVVLFVLWYCYKRGREVRLEAEAAAAAAALVNGGEGGVIEGSADIPEAVLGNGQGKENV